MKKIVQKIIALTAILIGMTGWSGDSAPFLLDTIEPLVEPGEEVLFTYNSTWIGGDSSAEVVISANGTEIKRATGEGNFTWGPATPGKHTLTYTTYIDGVLQEEVYTASVFKDWKYTVENDKATIIETTQTSGNATIPSEIDGYPVVGVNESIFEDCTSVTIHVSVSLNNTIDLKHCKNLESITMEYAGVDGNTPTKVYLDDELLLSSAEGGTYTWVPYPAGVHELRCETGSKTLTILVNTLLSSYVDSPILPNPPGVKDDTLSLSVERKEFTSAKRSAGTFSVTSTTGSGTWSASASEEWISLTKTSGSVSDKVSYIVEANASAQARVGYVYVSGHIHTIVQPGTGVTVTPSSLNVGHQGVTQSIAVDTLVDGASWVARSESQWISVAPVSGSGDGNVNIQVAPYYIVGTREGTATIAGETVAIFQRGRDMELTNYSTNITSTAQSVLVGVSAIPDVTWSIVSGADWITVSHPGSGLGSSTVDLTIAENKSFLPRTATVAIGTEVFTITQYGATSLIFSISESDVSVPATATSVKTLEITATPDLPWKITSNCNWLAPLNNYNTGDGSKTVAYSIAANPTLAPRSGKLTFTPDASSGLQAKTLTVTQAAAVSSIDSTSASLTAAATTVSVEVTVDPVVNWSVSSSVGWVTIDGSSSRTGAGTVELRVSENTSLSARNGTVTIAGHTYTVRQAGGKVGISSSSSSVVSSGGTLYINVTGSENLNWSIQNAVDWVTIEGDVSHTGPTTLVIRVEANTGTEDRKCEIIIGGEKLTIEQAAASTIVEEDVLIYGEDVDIGLFSVEAPDYLIWETFTENDDWIIVTSDSPTTGSGDVEYIVDGVDSGISRIGILWVGNTPVYICQSSFSAELSETFKEVSRLSGNGQIAFEVGEGNKWSAVSTVPWIRLANSEGEGDGFVSFEYDENTTEGERVGRIIIVDKVFTITQSDVDPSVPRWTISYENLKGASNPNPSRYDEGSEVAFLPLTGVIGYTFTGWTPSSISASDTGNKIVRANWVANNYTLKFDANGGFGEMPDQLMTYGTVTAIADNTFTRLGYQFAGWKLDLSGDVVFADRALVMNLSSIPDGVVRLYAAWTPVAYNISYEDTKGAMNNNPSNYTIEDTVTFSPLANVPGYAFIRWVPESISAGTTGDITVTALWRRELNFDDLVDSGLAQITNGGSANWYKESNVTYNGGDVWRSGIISDSQSSWMEIEIENATEFSFSWKVSSESNYDKLSWSLDGVQQAQISGSTQWVEIGREISPGKHKIRFEYSKDSSVSSNDDCGYISGFTVLYPETVSVTFDLCGNGTRLGGGELEQEIEFGTAPVLPTVSPNAGWRFLGWFTAQKGGEEVTSETVVSADMTIYAHWERSLIAVDEPVVAEGLIYNGSEQVGVAAADGYTLSGVIAAVDAGEYIATATLADGYKWADGSMEDKTITWSIAKAANEWITEPKISIESWTEGETAGELTDGVAKFGAVVVTIAGEEFTALPTAPGSYTIEYSVAETGNYSGLIKFVSFEINKYVPIISEITYENLRGAMHTNPETYQEGSVIEFTNPSEVEGYTFAGWTPERISADMTGMQTIRANWMANKYTIVYNANGGNGTMEATLATYDSEVIVKDNAFVREGYTFKGWALEEGSDVVYAPGQSVINLTALLNGVVTFYAVWERILIAVDEPIAAENLIYNGTEQVGVAAADGYTLSGVIAATDAGEYTAIATLADGYKWADGSMEDKTITWSIAKAANEWITEPKISIESWTEGETAGELTDGVANFGAVVVTIAGEEFTALPTAPGSYTIEYSVAETGNYSGLIKFVSFEINKYVPIISEITYENLRGAMHTNPETYQEGTVVEFTNPSAVEGYTFAGWTPERISADMTGAQTVRANWTANNYTIAYNANGGNGTMEATLATYDSEVIVKDNAFVREGYTFKGWALEEGGDVAYAPGQTVINLTAQADGVVTFYAVWERILIAVDEPVAAENLIYNGTEQVGVAAAEGYTLSGVTAATDVGEYIAIATLADGYKWADGSLDDKTITWSIAKAANEWITEPKISLESWTEGETVGELTDGVAKFGEVAVTINGAAFTEFPTAIGSYSIEYTVDETSNYSGLNKLIMFEILQKPVVLPTINPDWGYIAMNLGKKKNEVAIVFTNDIEKAMIWTVPDDIENVQFLVVGGGGGGGSAGTGGGGGAGGGGVVTGMIHKLEMDSTISVVVGAGGAEGTRNSAGGLLASAQGGNSTLTIGSVGAITAYGGAKVHKDSEHSGGSGNGSYGAGKAGTATKGKVDLSVEELVYSVESFGNNGGYGYNNKIGGGGGGAYPGDEGRGGSATSSVAGKGGAGLVSDITGESITYGSGGGGSTSTVGAEGGEGAGNGCSNKSAKANQGGGGGGAGKYSSGGKGGSGIVVIRYTIPGYLLPEVFPEVTDDSKVAAALEGSADVKLVENIKTAAEYTAFREWALNLEGATPEEVKASPNAWLSYALNTDKLIIAAPKEGDVVIDTFEIAATEGAFEFTVKIDGIAVGDSALEANLKKVFDVEGAETLASGGAGFSSDNVEVNAVAPVNGNVKFTVTPKMENGEKPDSFFFRVKMK